MSLFHRVGVLLIGANGALVAYYAAQGQSTEIMATGALIAGFSLWAWSKMRQYDLQNDTEASR